MAQPLEGPRGLKGHLTNQHVDGEQVQPPTSTPSEGVGRGPALAGVVYDVLNDVGLGIALSKRQAEKNLLLGELWEDTPPTDGGHE